MSGKALQGYYRCPERYADFGVAGALSSGESFFQFGGDAIGYGATVRGYRADRVEGDLYDALANAKTEDQGLSLPFELTRVIDNLRHERYAHGVTPDQCRKGVKGIIRNAYYWLRPMLPVAMRKHLQHIYLRGWEQISFPRWPVDCSVEEILEKVLMLVMDVHGVDKIPFIWFWPYGNQCCAIVTHDVETAAGRDFCGRLMDLNDAYGVKSSFQIVPEERYSVPESFLTSIRERGFEINLHDFNHDGHLFSDHREFLRRAACINQYAKAFDAVGFRSAVMYRNLDWFDAFEFSYDMSVPNVAHLDPQRGGCCTVMPYFIGEIVELPLTTTQDYSLFNILNEKSIALWKRQIEMILQRNGLISVLVHPDYIIDEENRNVYQSLLAYLREMSRSRGIWMALPREVDRWWRQRSRMMLVENNGKLEIAGGGKERARIAYAKRLYGRIAYEVEEQQSSICF